MKDYILSNLDLIFCIAMVYASFFFLLSLFHHFVTSEWNDEKESSEEEMNVPELEVAPEKGSNERIQD